MKSQKRVCVARACACVCVWDRERARGGERLLTASLVAQTLGGGGCDGARMKLSKVPPGCRYLAVHNQIPGEHRWVGYKSVQASGLRTVTSVGAGRKKLPAYSWSLCAIFAFINKPARFHADCGVARMPPTMLNLALTGREGHWRHVIFWLLDTKVWAARRAAVSRTLWYDVLTEAFFFVFGSIAHA